MGGELHYGVPDENDPNLRLFRQTTILNEDFVINLSGFIPQDEKDLELLYANDLIISTDQNFKVRLLMIQDHGSGNILAYLSTYKTLANGDDYIYGTSRLALSVLNDHFALGVTQRPYWFYENWHRDANIIINISCILQDNRDHNSRGFIKQ